MRYWVEAKRYSTIDEAEAGLDTLRRAGLNGTIAIPSADEYLLRLGPFAAVDQAREFEAAVRTLSDFSDTPIVRISIPSQGQ